MSIQIKPASGFVMAYCNNEHTGVGLSIELTPDEAHRLARDLIAAANACGAGTHGGKIGNARASWTKASSQALKPEGASHG